MKMKLKIVSLFLVLTMVCSIAASAVVMPRASDYLSSYTAYLNADGSGKISVWFVVGGTGTMEEIGALTIALYESDGTHVKTYRHTDFTNMLGYNKATYGSSVSYNGTSGKSYYAYVTVWAGKNGNGDSRQIYASSVKA